MEERYVEEWRDLDNMEEKKVEQGKDLLNTEENYAKFKYRMSITTDSLINKYDHRLCMMRYC
jgi:hypothetical protein